MTVTDQMIVGVVVTLGGVISALGIRFANLNAKIVDSYFADQKQTNVALAEVTQALKDHSKACIDGQHENCKGMAEVVKGQIQIVNSIHEHDKHMADDRRKMAEELRARDMERTCALLATEKVAHGGT